jgi:hypothetical protein
VPIATGDIPNPVESLARAPTREEIARRAYQIYVDRGAEHGRDWDDWLQADGELRELAVRDVTVPPQDRPRFLYRLPVDPWPTGEGATP